MQFIDIKVIRERIDDDAATQKVIRLPFHLYLSAADQDRIIEVVVEHES